MKESNPKENTSFVKFTPREKVLNLRII